MKFRNWQRTDFDESQKQFEQDFWRFNVSRHLSSQMVKVWDVSVTRCSKATIAFIFATLSNFKALLHENAVGSLEAERAGVGSRRDVL